MEQDNQEEEIIYANDTNELENRLSDLMIDESSGDIEVEDRLDHSPLASVQEIDADDNEESLKTKNRQFRIDDEQIIDDKQLLEHQENDKKFLVDESLVKLFKIYQNLLKKRKNQHQHQHQHQQHDHQNHHQNKKFFINRLNDLNNNNGRSVSSGIDYDTVEQMDQECYEMSSDSFNNHNDDGAEYDEQDDDDTIKINEVKSVLQTSSMLNEHNDSSSSSDLDDLIKHMNDNDLPKNLIVASIPSEVFEKNNEYKSKFEKLFTDIDSNCKFCYFRIFKRCCIQYENGLSAVLARFQLDDQIFLNDRLRIFLTKPIKLKHSRPFLEPPQNEKTFLISPPSSPPVGWEQQFEDPPIVNLDLLAALAKLKPDEPCEIVKSTCARMPSIIIHPCADLVPDISDQDNLKRKYIPTKRPAFDI